jgi:branched-chain amino acid transport system permease protein
MLMELFAQLTAIGIITGCLYALYAVSWGIIFKVTKTFHFAHGIVYTTGAYACVIFTNYLGVPLILSALCAIAISALAGGAIELFTYRPLRKIGSAPLTILISSLGTLIVVENLFAMIMGSQVIPITGFHAKAIFLGPVVFTNIQVAIVIVSLILVFGLIWFLYKTPTGRMLQAVASNSEMAEVIGIDSPKVYLLTYAIGSALMGAAGVLSLLEKGANPYMGTMAILLGSIAVIMGGVESIPGGAISGFILGLAINLSVITIPSEWQYAIAFGIVIVIIILRPEGILARKTG